MIRKALQLTVLTALNASIKESLQVSDGVEKKDRENHGE